jgi:hypothetical protein
VLYPVELRAQYYRVIIYAVFTNSRQDICVTPFSLFRPVGGCSQAFGQLPVQLARCAILKSTSLITGLSSISERRAKHDANRKQPVEHDHSIGRLCGQLNGRGREIRTPDPLLPKQMRYQAALCPDTTYTEPS